MTESLTAALLKLDETLNCLLQATHRQADEITKFRCAYMGMSKEDIIACEWQED